jgi:hypothetical protein
MLIRYLFKPMSTPSHLLFIRLSLVFLVGLFASNQAAMGAKPESLNISDKYFFPLIAVRTNSLGDFGIRLEVAETTTKVWKSPKQTKPSLASGEEVELAVTNTFSDYSVVNTKVTAKIEGNSVKVRGEWPTESTVQGFVRLDLWFSQEMAEDLTIYAHGEVLTTNMDKIISKVKQVNAIEFRKTSTGEFLFRVTGNLFASVMFLSDRPQSGLWVRLGTTNNANSVRISDATEMEYTIEFDE